MQNKKSAGESFLSVSPQYAYRQKKRRPEGRLGLFTLG
jgi:hypothetical protein